MAYVFFSFLAIFNAIKPILKFRHPFGDFAQIWAFPGKPDYNNPRWESLLILEILVINRSCNLTGQEYTTMKEVFQILFVLVLKCLNRSFQVIFNTKKSIRQSRTPSGDFTQN